MKLNETFLKKTYNRYLLPTMLSILGGTVTVLLDSVLISRVLGTEGLLIANISLPVHLGFATLGSLFASGAAVLSARAMGQNDVAKSRQVLVQATLLTLGSAVLLAALGLLFLPSLSALLSGGLALAGLNAYLGIIVVSSVAKALLYLPFFYLRIDGQNLQATTTMLLLTALHILLDILFLYGLRLGILGAALAFALSQLLAMVLGFVFLLRRGSFALPLKLEKFQRGSILPILKNGSPSALNNLSTAMRIFLLNLLFIRWFADSRMAVTFAILTALGEFSLFILNGVPQTALPLLNVYSAEASNAAIRLLLRRQLLSGLILMSLLGLLLNLFAYFGLLGMVYEIDFSLQLPLAMLSLSLLFAQINSIMTYYFNAIEQIALANFITLSRILVMPVLLLALLAKGGFDT